MQYRVIQIFTETDILGDVEYFRETVFESGSENEAIEYIVSKSNTEDFYIEVLE